jgi:hypothetical protein
VVQADGEDWRCSCGTRLTASASINRIRALLKTIIDTAQVQTPYGCNGKLNEVISSLNVRMSNEHDKMRDVYRFIKLS